jgi:hypothetical protein
VPPFPYGRIKSGTKQGMDLGLGRLAVVGGSRTMKRAWQRPWYRVPWVLELTISGEAHEKLRESDFGPVLRPGEPGGKSLAAQRPRNLSSRSLTGTRQRVNPLPLGYTKRASHHCGGHWFRRSRRTEAPAQIVTCAPSGAVDGRGRSGSRRERRYHAPSLRSCRNLKLVRQRPLSPAGGGDSLRSAAE